MHQKTAPPFQFADFARWYLRRDAAKKGQVMADLGDQLAEQTFISNHGGKYEAWFRNCEIKIVRLRWSEFSRMVVAVSEEFLSSDLIAKAPKLNSRLLSRVGGRFRKMFLARKLSPEFQRQHRGIFRYLRLRREQKWKPVAEDRIAIRRLNALEQGENPDGSFYIIDGNARSIAHMLASRCRKDRYAPVEAWLLDIPVSIPRWPRRDPDSISGELPKILHFTWKDKMAPAKLQYCLASFAALNPDWSIRFYDDADCLRIIKKAAIPGLVDAYLRLAAGIMRADIFRLVVLHEYGGVYADMDVECVSPLTERLKSLGLKYPYQVAVPRDHPIHERELYQGRKVWMNNFICALPKARFLAVAIDDIVNSASVYWTSRDAVNATGPLQLTRLVEKYGTRFLGVRTIPYQYVNGLPDPSNQAVQEEDLRPVLSDRDSHNGKGRIAIHFWWHSNLATNRFFEQQFEAFALTFDEIVTKSCAQICSRPAWLAGVFKEWLFSIKSSLIILIREGDDAGWSKAGRFAKEIDRMVFPRFIEKCCIVCSDQTIRYHSQPSLQETLDVDMKARFTDEPPTLSFSPFLLAICLDMQTAEAALTLRKAAESGRLQITGGCRLMALTKLRDGLHKAGGLEVLPEFYDSVPIQEQFAQGRGSKTIKYEELNHLLISLLGLMSGEYWAEKLHMKSLDARALACCLLVATHGGKVRLDTKGLTYGQGGRKLERPTIHCRIGHASYARTNEDPHHSLVITSLSSPSSHAFWRGLARDILDSNIRDGEFMQLLLRRISSFKAFSDESNQPNVIIE